MEVLANVACKKNGTNCCPSECSRSNIKKFASKIVRKTCFRALSKKKKKKQKKNVN